MNMHCLVFYVPETHAETVKAAVFEAGGGHIGNYDHCCWLVVGTGQFRPLAGSNPAIGSRGEIEFVPELKVELVVKAELLPAVIAALKKAHPYETPAFFHWPVGGLDA